MKPSLGRIVIYRSRTGSYDCAAIIAATYDSLNIDNVEKGWIPNLSGEAHVHLVVFSAGKPQDGRTAQEAEAEFLVSSPHGVSINSGGTYQEWDIPYDLEGGPGTWRWPTRIE
jgi:hypothetical protein